MFVRHRCLARTGTRLPEVEVLLRKHVGRAKAAEKKQVPSGVEFLLDVFFSYVR